LDDSHPRYPEAIAAIQAYTEGMRFEDFVSDRRTVDAVIRNLITIGEAAARLPDETCQKDHDIPWYEMRGMRNFVIHEYFGINDNVLWDTIKMNLPPLVDSLKRIIER
jgi:uncharacterized protein with HEPN domain